ncbi:MAG: TRAP transporter substrate-binding protein [Syntrophomonadaceae bacterium]|nr:TRAP transporter substrate-binding protein [Syntrophomonadaceae bacterium]
MYKKTIALLLVLLLAFSVVGCGQREPAAQKPAEPKVETYTIRFGMGAAEGSSSHIGAQRFKEILERESKGRFKVDLFPGGQLGADLSMMQGLQMGTLDMTMPATAPIANLTNTFLVFDLPYLVPDIATADRILDGPAGQALLKSLEPVGIVGLAFTENGFRHLTNSAREVKKVEDLKGLKIRVMQNPIHIDVFKNWGAIPTPMPFGEVFTALEQKVVDGQENPIPLIFTSSFHEVNKFISLTGHVYSPFVIMFSKSIFDKFTPAEQEMIRKAAREMALYQREVNRKQKNDFLERIRQGGKNVVTEIAPAERQRFIDSARAMYPAFEAKMDKAIFDQVMAELRK